ncbi:hypothetical protein Poli38472_001054 [Pythium oligandrum]|uniref:Uncharacterized protein n=1 Tax=Pythium oligandrum TaxID=41045 RepID=A0A8K1CTY8_PYTOL|nr:hypothetical protein Poli38472_001054 [Pythium oligandrum]|eukprot:TMW68898.1 hypothetical protein Poli38472_001054 [Pythium oligandrum]
MKTSIEGGSTLFDERCKLTSAIVLLNTIIIAECVVLLASATSSLAHPTPAFVVFMVMQSFYLATAAVLSVAACAARDKMLVANRGFPQVVAFTNTVYAIIFFVRKDVQGGLAMGFLAIVNVLGVLVCRRFFL